MPNLAEQMTSCLIEDQEDILSSFVVAALIHAAPNNDTLIDIVRNACGPIELMQLDRILRIPSDVVRSCMFVALVGEVASRCALARVQRYNETGQDSGL